jgi:hypothetical protein
MLFGSYARAVGASVTDDPVDVTDVRKWIESRRSLSL